jgi:LuxR family quorum sensing-dependent transcriptional regulator
MGMYAFEHIRQIITANTTGRFERLTQREREVLTWTAVGKTSAEVAEIMNLSKRTVDEYSVRAARKLRAQNKTHAVVKALQQRLISP